MPAYRERVYLCPRENGQPTWVLGFPLWWDRDEFFKQFGDRRIDTGNPFYVDYALLLAGGEAMAWDRGCKEQFARDPRSNEAFFQDELQRWEEMLISANWVIIESYEWESALEYRG